MKPRFKAPVRAANDHLVLALRELDKSQCPEDIALALSLERLLTRFESRVLQLEIGAQAAA